jgi:hypothetical protein
MKHALIFYCMTLAAAGVAIADTPPAAEEKPKNPSCLSLQLNAVGMIDDRTAILEMSANLNSTESRRRFKVTFTSNCKRLAKSHFFHLKSTGCPRRGDVVVFSRRPNPSEDDIDQCTIKEAEEIPVQDPTPKP